MPVQPATSSKQKYSSNVLKQKTDEEKKEELISAMITKMVTEKMSRYHKMTWMVLTVMNGLVLYLY